jgi:hypothetical protein
VEVKMHPAERRAEACYAIVFYVLPVVVALVAAFVLAFLG